MIHFIADLHFGHGNIIEYSHRPFENVSEMDDSIVERWNSVVGKNDTVIIAGDFCLGNADMAARYFLLLRGHVVVIADHVHHDRRWARPGASFHTMTGMCRVHKDSIYVISPGTGAVPTSIIVSHYPMCAWPAKHYGSWHIHGHIHEDYSPEGFALNVCADVVDFTPVSLTSVADYMEKERGWDSSLYEKRTVPFRYDDK